MAPGSAAAGLGDLALRFGLDPIARERLGRLLELLVEDPHAPTTIRDRPRALDEHLADSLVGLGVAGLREARSVADLGSGAGLPALPLGIALPGVVFTLVESAGRRCAFLERAAAACGLDNVRVRHARAEEVAGPFDIVTARALASLPVVMEYAAPLLREGGTLIAWRGRRESQDELEAEAAAAILGLRRDEVRSVTPWPGARHRHLHLVSKVSPTPDWFPRRPGMAAKRPLGRSGSSPSGRADHARARADPRV